MTTALKSTPLISGFSEGEKARIQGELNKLLSVIGMKETTRDSRGIVSATLVKVDWTDREPPALAWFTPGTADITLHMGEFMKMHPDLTPTRLIGILGTISYAAQYLAGQPKYSPMNKADTTIAREIIGLLFHEGGHSHFSTWGNGKIKATPEVIHTMVLFEEGRVEKRVVDKHNAYQPKFRVKEYLRAVGRLLLGQMDTTFPNLYSMLGTWALVKSRAAAGTLSPEEFAPIDNAVRAHVGDELVDLLTDVYEEALMVDVHKDLDRFIELAGLWNEFIEEVSGEGPSGGNEAGTGCSHQVVDKTKEGDGDDESEEEADDTEEGEGAQSESGNEGEGDKAKGKNPGKPGGDTKSEPVENNEPKSDLEDEGEFQEAESIPIKEGEANTSALGPDAKAAVRKAIVGLVEDTEWEKPMLDTDLTTTARGANVFINRPDYERASRWEERKPTAIEITASNRLATHLETLMVPTIAQTKVLTDTPTGRLKGREAVRRSAERSQGRMTTAKPWIDKSRKHTLGAPAIVGIATDTSGSMSWAQSMVASAAYIVGRAGHRINAKTAAVTFGSHVEAVLAPGEVPNKVRERVADGGVEELDLALAALDAALGLTTTPGAAKVLVIISDNELVKPFEPDKRAIWLKKLADAGVTTIWVDQSKRTVDNATSVGMDWRHTPSETLPLSLVNTITKALDEAIAKKGRGR